MDTLADKAIVLWRSERFRNWIMVCLGGYARTVYGEQASVRHHDARLVLARKVIADPARSVDPFVNALVSDDAVAPLGGVPEADWTDTHLAALRGKVADLWTPLALDGWT